MSKSKIRVLIVALLLFVSMLCGCSCVSETTNTETTKVSEADRELDMVTFAQEDYESEEDSSLATPTDTGDKNSSALESDKTEADTTGEERAQLPFIPAY